MLNWDGKENGTKINRCNSQKNKLQVKHTFCSCSTLFIFLCHCFAQLQCCLVGLLTRYFVSCVHVRFYFSLPLIFTLLAASIISHFLTSALNFHVFLPTKFSSFVSNHSLSLFLCYPRECKHQK